MKENIQIKFTNVFKEFYLQGDRTFKELIPNLIKGKKWAKKLNVFSNITFDIQSGETVGIVGKNGAGKSTIMKLIAGVTYPTKGEVSVIGRVAPMIELGAGFHYELNGYENIYLNSAILGMHKKEIELVIQDIIEFSEIRGFLHEPLKHFSTGMVMRLAFSIAVHARAKIFLIDEVLAVGDINFQKKCINKLNKIKNEKDTIIIFVSHDQKAVESFCDRAILIDKGEIVLDSSPKEVFLKYNDLES
jgi:ABC-type polysaccharide/polyol phosphate transport system ATPase subunit